jgi:hypothetical protein
MKKQLQTGHAYTLVTITWMATTLRMEIFVTGHNPRINTYFYRKSGNGKINTLTQRDLDQALVFEGHNIPFTLDTETDRFSGNAQYNFVTEDPITLKAFIQQHCLNPCRDNFDKILYQPPAQICTVDTEGMSLFGEGA